VQFIVEADIWHTVTRHRCNNTDMKANVLSYL